MNIPQAYELVKMGKSLDVKVNWTLMGAEAIVFVNEDKYLDFHSACTKIRKTSERKSVSQYILSCLPRGLIILSPKVQVKIQLSQN